ncbi:MAG: energy-coupling factor ABC transporter permease [Alphaproteobacteria bacterium]|nr:energy-coupling factor ABC transporter permease [Alphaproteobacteria bacterium]
MHIPDGFVSGPINGAAGVLAAAVMAYSLQRVQNQMQEKAFAVPLLATMAAFVFAAQMLNFPIGGGTSGHFLGAVTVAALLGPWSACVVLSLVLVVQALLFGDGGLTALGSNVLNMGIAGGIFAYPVMRGVRALLPAGRTGYLASVAFASWVSIVLASIFCALELAASGTSPFKIVLPAMAGTHAVIGIGEALIASALLATVAAARPDIVPAWARLDGSSKPQDARMNVWRLAATGFALAVFLALFASPFASAAPDGLEKIAEKKGFVQTALESPVWTHAALSDYKVQDIKSESLSTGLAGLIGTILVFGLGFAVIRWTVRPSERI